MMKKCVIAIPIYKVKPTHVELASFKQVFTILRDYDICIFTYDGIDLGIYEDVSKECNKNFSLKYFDKKYFASVEGYNNLCYEKNFYQSYAEYEYMLIYQLDAWVFRDELNIWCDKGYDYIGAPFFRYINRESRYSKTMIGVGNGGFSLRRIEYCIRLLERRKILPYLTPGYLWKIYPPEEKKGIRLLSTIGKVLLRFFGYESKFKGYNEDIYFGSGASFAWGVNAKLPTCEEASHFSFEINPSYLYSLNKELPFGCHAFEKWEYDTFWRNNKFITI